MDSSNWTYETGNGSGGWGNNELQYYTNRSQNIKTTGGNLIITALKESYNGFGYTSARIKTQDKKAFTYGSIESRMKLPKGQGIWSAFWMLGSNIPSVGWPKCGEIDIMEHVSNSANYNGTIHWSDASNIYANYGGETPCDVTQWHNYKVVWDSSKIQWYIDGTKWWEANIANNINGSDEFHKPMFILFKLAVGGNWPGNPDASTVLLATMEVDYVRVSK